MMNWLSMNLINIVLVAVILLVSGFLIRGMIRDRKAGKCACGSACKGNCASCGLCGGRSPHENCD